MKIVASKTTVKVKPLDMLALFGGSPKHPSDKTQVYWLMTLLRRAGLARKVGYPGPKPPGAGRPAVTWEMPKTITFNLD